MAQQFTKGEVDYLVLVPKCIKTIPTRSFLSPRLRTGWIIQTSVSLKADLTPISGLLVMAKAHQAPVGLPRPTPSVALVLFNKRIRGLNYELWHDNPDGTRVKGWHEHIWSPEEEDQRVIAARPTPQQKDLFGLLKWGLKKWNIEVRILQRGLDEDGD